MPRPAAKKTDGRAYNGGNRGVEVYQSAKKEREAAFHDAIKDGDLTPEGLILDVMRNKPFAYDELGERVEYTEKQYQAAKDLLPYRLPRLNAIDATAKVVGMTQEEWIKMLANDMNGEE